MSTPPSTARVITLLLLSVSAALVARSWLQIQLTQDGVDARTAGHLSYLVVPLITAFLLLPTRREAGVVLRSGYAIADLTPTLIACAILIGLGARLLVLGLPGGVTGDTSNPPMWSELSCSPPLLILLALGVSALLTPIVEETVFRGLLLKRLQKYGCVLALVASSLLFAVFHLYETWLLTGLMGLLMGIQAIRSGSLWPSTITHASYNALVQAEIHCGPGVITNEPGRNSPIILFATALAVVALVALTPGAANRSGRQA